MVLNNSIPSVFATFCKVAGLSPERISGSWKKIWEKVVDNFFVWLSSNCRLTQAQTALICNSGVATPLGEADVMKNVMPFLEPEQRCEAERKLATLIVDNLASFFGSVYRIMTVEQRQVVNAFLKTNRL